MKREIYAQAKEWLADKVEERDALLGLEGLQHFTVLYSDGTPPHKGSTACYSSVYGRDKISHNAEAIVSLTTHYRCNKPTMEDTGEYYSWLIKESPFAPIFKSKNVKKAVEEGLICHTNQRQDLTASALISARMAYEHPHAVRIWATLVRGGVHPSLAFCLMGTFKVSGGMYVVQRTGGAHFIIPYHVSKGFLHNFMCNSPICEEVSFKEYRGYMNNSSMWGNTAGLKLSDLFEDTLRNKYPSKKTLFGGTLPAGTTRKQLIEEVLSFQEKFFKEYKV